MPRPPVARRKILDAARRIVEDEGAGALTFDELSKVSGVTRGGITYHFPTKDALLRALLEHDMAQWEASEAALRPSVHECSCPRQADLLAQIRSHTSQDDARRRFVAGMLSAAVHQPELLDPCRGQLQQRFAERDWDEAALRDYLLRLASAGLFWEEIFQLSPLPPHARQQLVALLERLAREWAPPSTIRVSNQ